MNLISTLKSASTARRNAILATALVVGLAGVQMAQAGTTGSEFYAFYNMMIAWTGGYLGKGIALAAFLLGAGMGVAKSTILPAIIGLVFAVVFTVGPSVITGMMTATI